LSGSLSCRAIHERAGLPSNPPRINVSSSCTRMRRGMSQHDLKADHFVVRVRDDGYSRRPSKDPTPTPGPTYCSQQLPQTTASVVIESIGLMTGLLPIGAAFLWCQFYPDTGHYSGSHCAFREATRHIIDNWSRCRARTWKPAVHTSTIRSRTGPKSR